MRAIVRSFLRSFDGGFRFSLVLFASTMIVLAVVNTSPGSPLHPWGNDSDGVKSPTLVVQ